jgi:hypothetical protein
MGVHSDWMPRWAEVFTGGAMSHRGVRQLSAHLLREAPPMALSIPSALRWVAWPADAIDALAKRLFAAAVRRSVLGTVARKEVMELRALIGDEAFAMGVQAEAGWDELSVLLPRGAAAQGAAPRMDFGSPLAQGRHLLMQRLFACSEALALRMQWKYPAGCSELYIAVEQGGDGAVKPPIEGAHALLDRWLEQQVAAVEK